MQKNAGNELTRPTREIQHCNLWELLVPLSILSHQLHLFPQRCRLLQGQYFGWRRSRALEMLLVARDEKDGVAIPKEDEEDCEKEGEKRKS